MDMNNDEIIKICVSSIGQTLNSEIDPRFGRCKYFLIVNIKDKKILSVESVKNEGFTKDRGAGISAAGQIGRLKARAIITGNIGPKADEVLKQLNIKVYKKSGLVKAAINDYLNNDKDSDNAGLPGVSAKNTNKSNIKQRIFIPLMDNNGKDSEIALHFGRASYFALYESVENKLMIEKNSLDHNNPDKTPVEQIIETANPTIVYARDMGPKAVKLFSEKNIILKTGPYNTLKEVIENIENLEDLKSDCGH